MISASCPTRINALGTEQLAQLAAYAETWRCYQFSTAPAERATAEAGVRAAYRAASFPPPRNIVWCGGPLEIVRERRAMPPTAVAGDNLRAAIIDRMRRQSNAAIEDRLSIAARKQMSEFHFFSVNHPTVDGALRSVSLGEISAKPRLIESVRLFAKAVSRGRLPIAWRPLAHSGYSQHELGWLGRFRFCHDVCGLRRETSKLEGLWWLATSAGWIVPYEEVCWLSERHNVLKCDDRGRLHCEDGPAIQYPDGWSAYWWKGIALPASLIEGRDRMTVKQIKNESNRILRRCMIEIMTPRRFIELGGAHRICKDETGVLWHCHWFDGDVWAAVEVINGTPFADGTRTHYFLQVPSNLFSARAAVAWTYGLIEREYVDLVHRT